MFATPFPISVAPSVSAFPFASLLHIDAQQIAGADNTKILTTPNLGTAGGNITSPNTSNTPTIRTGGQNGMRYLSYGGSTGAYNEGDATLISGLGTTAVFTLFCVCTLEKPPAGQFMLDGGYGSGGTDARVIIFDQFGISFGRVSSGYLLIPNASYSAAAVKCMSGTVNAGSSIFRLNGISNVTGTLSTTANAWTAFTLGSQSGVHGLYLTFSLYEMIIVSGALSSGDITTCETFLVNKYALT